MPVGIVCPRCGTPLTFHRAPVAACPRCQAEFPQALRQGAEASLARQEATRPLLLTLGCYASPGVGALCLLSVLSALSGSGTFVFNGQPVSSAEFLASAGVLFVSIGVVSIAIGVGLVRERTWSRWLIVLYWALSTAGAIGAGWARSGGAGAAMGVISVLPPALFSYWYLFEKENVVAYYRALRMHEEAGGLVQSNDGGA